MILPEMKINPFPLTFLVKKIGTNSDFSVTKTPKTPISPIKFGDVKNETFKNIHLFLSHFNIYTFVVDIDRNNGM